MSWLARFQNHTLLTLMTCTKFAQLKLIAFRSIALFVITTSMVTAAPQAPSNVSAILYSNTAAELFWTPTDGQRVEVLRNGESLGIFDARSLWQDGLNPSTAYQFTLRSVDSAGAASQSWLIDVQPGNFPLANNRIDAYQGSVPVTVAQAPQQTPVVATTIIYKQHNKYCIERIKCTSNCLQVSAI